MDVQVSYRCVDVWRWRGRSVDASVRRCKWTEAREKICLRFVRSQSHFKRLKTSHSHFKNLTSNRSKQVCPKENRKQVEADTKWICVRFILVPKTSGEQISCEQRLKANQSDFKYQTHRKYAVSALQVISSTLADRPLKAPTLRPESNRHYNCASFVVQVK